MSGVGFQVSEQGADGQSEGIVSVRELLQANREIASLDKEIERELRALLKFQSLRGKTLLYDTAMADLGLRPRASGLRRWRGRTRPGLLRLPFYRVGARHVYRGCTVTPNSRLSVAVHILALLALNKGQPLTSDYIARSVNTNPVVIRRLLGRLRRIGLVRSQGGIGGGWDLVRGADLISLSIFGERYRRTACLSCITASRIQNAWWAATFRRF